MYIQNYVYTDDTDIQFTLLHILTLSLLSTSAPADSSNSTTCKSPLSPAWYKAVLPCYCDIMYILQLNRTLQHTLFTVYGISYDLQLY